MTRHTKLVVRVMRGTSDANIPFAQLCQLLRGMGFAERVRGGHHIFSRDDVEEILNLQPTGDLAKSYQVKQVRALFLRYGMGGADE